MKRLFISIYILTMLDAICTSIGVTGGVIEEGNPLVQSAMMLHPVITGAAVCAAIGLVLYGIWKVRDKVKWLPYALGLVLAVKVGIMGMHLYWITSCL